MVATEVTARVQAPHPRVSPYRRRETVMADTDVAQATQESQEDRELGTLPIPQLFIKYSAIAFAGMIAQIIMVVLEGIIMGTRCGCIDPEIVTYLQEKENLTTEQMHNILNKKSGFLGLSCISSDARDLNDAANAGDKKAKLTLKKLVYDITKYIGAYTAVMNGVDLIVFTGGIGENNSRLRRRVCENLSYLGLKFDYEANVATGKDTLISLPESRVKVAVIIVTENNQ